MVNAECQQLYTGGVNSSFFITVEIFEDQGLLERQCPPL